MRALPIIVGGVLGVVVLMAVFGGRDLLRQDTDARVEAASKRALVLACRRGNVSRAWERRGEVDRSHRADSPRDRETAREIFPIVDCGRAANGQEARVAPAVEFEYIRLVIVERCRPLLELGRIVTCEPFASAR